MQSERSIQQEGITALLPERRRRLRRFLAILLPTALLFLGLEPWGLQASLRPPANGEPLPSERSIEIVAVGDIMAHLSQVRAARVDGGYDFAPQFAALKERIDGADLAIGNLETTLGKGVEPTGYPKFISPPELARDLGKTGFDLLVTANNHALDNGEKGVLDTLDILRDNGIAAVGTARGPDGGGPVVMEKNGIRVAFLAYTCSTNGIDLPGSKPYLVSLYSAERVAADVTAARRQDADLIVAYVHFGVEYQRYPDPQQYRIAAALHKAGVHVVLGSHPHVVQPQISRLREKRYTLFSLGNFISGQRANFTDIGLLVSLRVTKTLPGGITVLDRVEQVPTYVERSKTKQAVLFRVVPLQQVDRLLSKRYREQLTYNRNSLQRDLLGHVRGGVYLDEMEETRP